MPYRASFRCVAGCPGDLALDEPVYRCPSCGQLLEVVHDVEALADRTPSDWQTLFDRRDVPSGTEHGSRVWSKKEWVCPSLSDGCIVTMQEGGTPLLRIERLAAEYGLSHLWIKQCGLSHTGSFKDLGMTVLVSMVRQMIVDGRHIRAIVCASSGDTSASLAAYAAAAGIPALVILPRGRVSMAQLLQPLANGALVLSVDTDFDGCMAIVQRLVEDEGLYLANSMNSLRLEGQKTVGIEIVQQLEWTPPDVVVVPGGNLGNVSALGAGFDMMAALGLIDEQPRLVVAQAEAANPLYLAYRNQWRYEPMAAGPTLASAIQIGNPVSVHKAILTLQRHRGCVEQATEQELAEAAARADRCGMLACPHTGVALAALRKLVERGEVGRNERVVVLSTASGLKFAEFTRRYHEGTLPFATPLANRPVEVPNEVDAVRRVLDRHLRAEREPWPDSQ